MLRQYVFFLSLTKKNCIMLNRKTLLIIALGLIIIGYFGYRYAYQSHRDIESEKAAFSLQASDLISEFSQNSEAATQKYENKTIQVSGTITDQDGNALTVDGSIFAEFSGEIGSVQGAITFKGRCVGYDDLLEEIKFDQCSLSK